MITTLPCLYFNSIKVRLKHTAVESSDGTTRFQFHKGTIKTRVGRIGATKLLIFQFHKGTIKTARDIPFTATAALFQFHKGTIKTKAATKWLHIRKVFQFHKGTIKTALRAIQ